MTLSRDPGFKSHRDYGTLDCRYCGAKNVPKVNANQVTCGKTACKEKRGNERRKVNFQKEKERNKK